jgi:CDP-4-dehydro-6-deoxyglucose reductase
LLPSGNKFSVEPGQPLLAAGIARGVALPYSCKTGLCRTCRGKVATGEVDVGEVGAEYLPEQERAQGYVLLCRATARTDCSIHVQEGSRAVVPKVLPARVASLVRAADDVALVTLRLPMNQKLMARAGQFIEILLEGGVRRSYSVANAPPAQGLGDVELHIRHLPGGVFTDRVFSSLKEREMLRFEGPFGSFCLREESQRPMLMIASGTGFAPIKAMVQAVLERQQLTGASRSPPIFIYWGGRRRADLYMANLAQRWSEENSFIEFVPVLSDAGAGCEWTGRTGFVHQVAMQDHPDLSGFEVYACGAPVMVEAARQDFTSRCGLPQENFHADAFLTAADRAAQVA